MSANSIQDAGQQRLSEPSWATQKHIIFLNQLINEFGFVYINASFCTKLLKILYSYRINPLLFHIRYLLMMIPQIYNKKRRKQSFSTFKRFSYKSSTHLPNLREPLRCNTPIAFKIFNSLSMVDLETSSCFISSVRVIVLSALIAAIILNCRIEKFM